MDYKFKWTVKINVNPVSQSITEGSSTSFSVAATGNGSLSYDWYVSKEGGSSWAIASDASGVYSDYRSPTLTLTNVPASFNGYQYRCRVVNWIDGVTAYQEVFSASATLTVTAALSAPVITGEPADATTIVGSSATFTVTATGYPAPTYQWQLFDGTNWINAPSSGMFTGATSPTLTVNLTTAAHNGAQYRCVVTNTQGSATTRTATLTVN